MPKYRISKDGIESKAPLVVSLEHFNDEGEVALMVDSWCVATLTSEGALKVHGCIGNSGLLTESMTDERIRVVDDYDDVLLAKGEE